MKWWGLPLAFVLLLAVLIAPRAVACGSNALELGVHDLNDQPVAGVVFDLDIAGSVQRAITDRNGTVIVTCLDAKTIRIVRASASNGMTLTMDENSSQGGLVIPLGENQTQLLPFRLSGTLLFVEPVAEGEQSAVFAPTAPVPPRAAGSPAAQVAPAPLAQTAPVPAAPRPARIWLGVLLILGVPCICVGVIWARNVGRRRGT